MNKALVVGGTGPTGPIVVNGLLDRGFEVTVFHTGLHEVEFSGNVEHIHGDPHFREPFMEAVDNRSWDVVVAGYGRLKLAAEVLQGHAGRVVALGGATGSMAAPDDPRWGPLGQHANVDDEAAIPESSPERNRFGYRMAQAEAALFDAHRAGHYIATYIGYPILYGPRQPAPQDWCIVRRVLDGRRNFILADGGLKLECRAYVENAAHAVLLAVDNPSASAGRRYTVMDDRVYSLRQRVEAIARHMGHAFEYIDMPYDLALPSRVLWRHARGHRLRDNRRIREELGYRDIVPADEALRRSVDWLLANRPQPGGEEETQLGDTFDYAREDILIRDWTRWRSQYPAVDYPLLPPAHMYRHPSQPHEPWKRPDHAQNAIGEEPGA